MDMNDRMHDWCLENGLDPESADAQIQFWEHMAFEAETAAELRAEARAEAMAGGFDVW